MGRHGLKRAWAAETAAGGISRRAVLAAGLAGCAVLVAGPSGGALAVEAARAASGPGVSDPTPSVRDARGHGRLGTVCVDPGHGAVADLTPTPKGPGSDVMQYTEPGGATGSFTGTPEHEVALAVGLALRDGLRAAGARVAMTRTSADVVLSSEARALVADACGADLFLRLHCDSSDDPSVRGFCTIVPGYNEWTAPIVEPSLEAALAIHPLVVEGLGAEDRGIVERSDLAGFNFCTMPALLFEMGFMSNPEEDALLSDPSYQRLLAGSIGRATARYLKSKLKQQEVTLHLS